jgi:hypothetical protein
LLHNLSLNSSIFKEKSLRSKLVFDKLVEVALKLQLSEEEQEEINEYLEIIKL